MAEKYTDAQKKATAKYLAKLDRLYIWCRKGSKEEYAAIAKARGYRSLSEFVIDLLETELKKEKQDD